MDYGDRNVDLTRREALRRGLLGAAGVAVLGSPGAWAQATRATRAAAPIARKPARARSVIQIWMWGGPSHLDTFDPKPEAGTDFCGPLNAPIATNIDGIRVGELLPLLAKQADKYSIIRGMTHGVNGHETATYLMQTGRASDRVVYPGLGAVVSLLRGYDQGYKGLVPPYVVLTEPQGRFSEAGFLGQSYKPFATGGDPNQARFSVEGIIAPNISDERQQRRRELMHALDSLGKAAPDDPSFKIFDQCEENAYTLMLGDARKLFDLSQEPDNVRQRYGRNTFGQSCLMARRLVQAGVPYVTINYRGWDTHKQHFQIMRRKLPEMDQGMAALLADLSERGLLAQTIVWWGGEFGRTPRVLWEPPWNGGRGHHGACFSAVVAGGGFKGGSVVGASDARGEQVADRPVYPVDLIGSIYELLGIDPDSPLPNARGLDAKLLPPADAEVKRGGRLTEIMEA